MFLYFSIFELKTDTAVELFLGEWNPISYTGSLGPS